MHRESLKRLLREYAESGRVTDSERPQLGRILEFVESEPRCFARDLEKGHITGSAWILNSDQTACLLTHHRKLGLWLQLGGHADGETDVRSVAHREAREESGIDDLWSVSESIFDVDVHTIPARKSELAHEHFDIRFLFMAKAGTRFVVSEESHDLAWVPRTEVAQYNTDASVLRMAEKWSMPFSELAD